MRDSMVTPYTRLLRSTTPADSFTDVVSGKVTLAPTLTGILVLGDTFSGETALNIPVAAGTRLLLVFSDEVIAGIDSATTVIGYTGAGLSIS